MMNAIKPQALHLGGFDQSIEGWTNTDITPHLLIARVPFLSYVLHSFGIMDRHRFEQHRLGTFRDLKYLNLAKPFPFPNDTIQFIYSSHVLEHLHRSAAENCIRECWRVLAPGGIVRIAVPDLDQVISSYNPAKPEVTLDALFELRSKSSKNRHWWHYNEGSLTQLLVNSGFRKAYRCEYGLSQYDRLVGIDNRPGSLIIEALK